MSYICETEPYTNCTIHGPYLRLDGRKHVVICFNSTKRTVSYPKFIMELHVGRFLNPLLETVDHIDRDLTNNEISNLRIVELSKHVREDQKIIKIDTTNCPVCGNQVSDDKIKTHYRNRNRKIHNNKAGPFCSRKCAGKYGAELQNKRIHKLDETKLNVTLNYPDKSV